MNPAKSFMKLPRDPLYTPTTLESYTMNPAYDKNTRVRTKQQIIGDLTLGVDDEDARGEAAAALKKPESTLTHEEIFNTVP